MSGGTDTAPPRPIEHVGLSLPAIAWRVSESLRARPDERAVLIVPDRAGAQPLLEALAFFTGTPEGAIPAVVEPYGMPYAAISPEAAWERDTATALARLAEQWSWRVIVVTARALLRRVPRPATVRRRVLVLGEGSQIDRDALVTHLEEDGYALRDAADTPGSFATRGGLVEIFAPFYPDPIRVDLFGDTVDTLHLFDADTLARKQRLDMVALTPVTLLMLDADGRQRARRAVRDLVAATPEGEVRVGEIDLALALEGRPPGYLNYLSVVSADLCPLAEYLPRDARWVVVDHHEVAEVLGGFDEVAARAHDQWIEQGEIGAPASDLFEPGATATALLARDDLTRYTRFRTDPARFEGREPRVRPLSALRTAVQAARKARQPEMRPFVDAVREALFSKHRHVGVVTEGRLRARHVKQALNLEGITCRIQAARDRGTPLPTHPVVRPGRLAEGFVDEERGVVWISESDLFEGPVARTGAAPTPAWEAVHRLLSQFKSGDLVVHDAYGIGRYHGVVRKRAGGFEADFAQIEYQGGDRVLLPVYKVDRLQRYVSGKGAIALDKLGSNAFERRKERVRKALERIAQDLVSLYAARRAAARPPFAPPGEDFAGFEAAFEHPLTADQERALAEVLVDLAVDHPMDRLLCGDVGFGKTEVAMRAAFLAASQGRQVAILVPTTVLAEQHRQTFGRRMEAFGLRVAGLTRFQSRAEQGAAIAEARAGRVDVLVGTHRLLQADVGFRDLGLVIVDEEHRFGVRQKEQLKQLRQRVDVLAMTATPIPRSLEMSLSGIRDLSVLTTAPLGRQPVRTVVTTFRAAILQEAIRAEVRRGGKVFVIHNRIESLAKVREVLERLVPEARIVVGHGKMGASELEEVMWHFVRGDADVLLSTTIVEAGLDIPLANTIIINQAHRLGLSELHQLRGRVGRSSRKATAYLLIPGERVLTPEARKRLRSIQAHADLGAGFQLAMEDLEIRGSGNLLGEAQSGHVEAVGYSLYMSLLEEAVGNLRGQEVALPVDTTVRVPMPAFLPEEWFPDESGRIALYQRLAGARGLDEVRVIEEELAREDEALPPPVAALLDVARIRVRASAGGASDVIVRSGEVRVRFDPARESAWQAVLQAIAAGELAFRPVADREIAKDLPVTREGGLLRAARLALKPVWACGTKGAQQEEDIP